MSGPLEVDGFLSCKTGRHNSGCLVSGMNCWGENLVEITQVKPSDDEIRMSNSKESDALVT